MKEHHGRSAGGVDVAFLSREVPEDCCRRSGAVLDKRLARVPNEGIAAA
jgi:hypothetical protein